VGDSRRPLRGPLPDSIGLQATPLVDETIAKVLKDKGIETVRCTVARYWVQLDIPPARMRREF